MIKEDVAAANRLLDEAGWKLGNLPTFEVSNKRLLVAALLRLHLR